ncbi:MAG: PIG-L family deacetylase [Candidatus Saccharimonadales bacterium]
MKKIIVGIFAHPDDEAFGPSATLLRERMNGADIHLICVTDGEAGANPDNHPNLAAVRCAEWREAGGLIGASSMTNLQLADSQLCNANFIPLAERLEKEIMAIADLQTEEYKLELMTLDLNGLTGHLDHILVARVTCFLHCKLKKQLPSTGKLRLFCVAHDDFPEINCDWIYMEPGRDQEHISETVDARDLYERVDEIMHTHRSQADDYNFIKQKYGERVAINHFITID